MTNLPTPQLLSEERQVCRAIASLGELAGIHVNLGEGPEDIDGGLIQAAYECHFDDPQFLGGAGCLGAASTAAELDTLRAQAQRVTGALVRYLRRRASSDALRYAQTQVDLVDNAFTSLKMLLERHAPGA